MGYEIKCSANKVYLKLDIFITLSVSVENAFQ